MRRRLVVGGLMLLLLLGVPTAFAATSGDSSQPAGPVVSPTGWQVRSAGEVFGVGRSDPGFQLPLGSALSPDGSHLLAASSGAARINSLDMFDLKAKRRQSYIGYDATKPGGPAVFYGVAYSPDGRKAWASGGGQNVVHTYDVTPAGLTETGQIQTPSFPAGLAYSHTPRGDRIYVANNLSAPASASNPPGHQVTVIDPKTNAVEKQVDLGTPLEPLGVAFDRSGQKAYVTNWMGRSVSVIDTNTEQKTRDIELSPPQNALQADHPSAVAHSPTRDEIYTVNANSDTVSVIDTRQNQVVQTIDVALQRGTQKGATPDGLAVSPDGRTMYVAEAGENAVAAIDLDQRQVKGFVPTQWYPTDVKVTPDGKQLVVTNGKDSGAGPNPCGPESPLTGCPPKNANIDNPGRPAPDSQYAGSMIKGSISVIGVPSASQLGQYTGQVMQNNHVQTRQPKPQALSQIKHVIYVVKENRTYDQVFGDLGKGNGDPRLALFKDDSAPNQRELARRFTLLDNFYDDAEVSADGHNWSTQANANDYNDKTWPINYSPSPRSGERAYDFEDLPQAAQFSSEPLASDPGVSRSGAAQTQGYLWDDAFTNKTPYRDYGEFTSMVGNCVGGTNSSSTTHLQARFGDHVDTSYPGWNLHCPDHTTREPEWEREFGAQQQSGNMPALSIVRLPNDHTNGTAPGQATPKSYVADNDLAVGRLVQAVSHSRFWQDTAIMVLEDDAQDGADHVDAHRSTALVISPFTQHGQVDSTHYDTSSMLATAEGLVGMPPMSIVDTRANRMWPAFGSQANLASFDAKQPAVTPFGDPGAPTNSASSPMAQASASWDFSKEDRAPSQQLNAAIWQSVNGPGSSMPPAPGAGQMAASESSPAPAQPQAADKEGDG